MNRAYTALILILVIPISAYAQSESETLPNGDASEDCLLSEMWPEAYLWELDCDLTYSEPSWADVDVLYDLLLELCLDLQVTDEEMYEMFPEPQELDYELYLFWEDDWYQSVFSNQ